MRNQIISYAELLPLGKFVGMETDSRSFLSYSRHDYFRRILCSVLGEWLEEGFVPYDVEAVGKTVRDICYNNAAAYFDF
jgi:glucuronate isomerase